MEEELNALKNTQLITSPVCFATQLKIQWLRDTLLNLWINRENKSSGFTHILFPSDIAIISIEVFRQGEQTTLNCILKIEVKVDDNITDTIGIKFQNGELVHGTTEDAMKIRAMLEVRKNLIKAGFNV